MAYWVTILTECCIFAILALGLNMVWGWSGDFDLAFYGYMALGTYTTMVVTIGTPVPPVEYILGWHLPFLVAIPVAMAVVVAFAAVIGAIALRNLREIYFAITTLGAISALYLVVQNYTPLFNGFNGLFGLVDPGQAQLHLDYQGYRDFLLAFCAGLLLAVYLFAQRVSTSPLGRMLRAVRDDERAAAVYGRNIFWAKYRAYLMGAALAGLAGALFAVYLGAFNPSAWAPQEILVLYAAILVGGRGNPRGVVLGVFAVYIGFVEMTRYLPSLGSRPEFAPAVRQIIIGLLIILMLRFRPQGLIPDRPRTDPDGSAGARAGPLALIRRRLGSSTAAPGHSDHADAEAGVASDVASPRDSAEPAGSTQSSPAAGGLRPADSPLAWPTPTAEEG